MLTQGCCCVYTNPAENSKNKVNQLRESSNTDPRTKQETTKTYEVRPYWIPCRKGQEGG